MPVQFAATAWPFEPVVEAAHGGALRERNAAQAVGVKLLDEAANVLRTWVAGAFAGEAGACRRGDGRRCGRRAAPVQMRE
jgi:hypothetical protein